MAMFNDSLDNWRILLIGLGIICIKRLDLKIMLPQSCDTDG